MWVEKYTPKTLNDFVGNIHAVGKAKNWIRKFPGKPSRTGERLVADRVLLLSGPEGSGKTLLAKLLLQDYKVFTFSLRDIRNHKKDKELLDNFCELYRANVHHLGSAHAIIVDDFDSLSDSKIDKVVHTRLVELIEKPLRGKPPPLILTMTTMSDVSLKKRNSNYQGLANFAYDIPFSPVRIPDLEDFLMKIARHEKVKCEKKVIPQVAEYCNGDVRKCVQAFEMLAKSAQAITNEKALEWIEQNTNDTDEKYLFQNDPGAKYNQTDDDRILQSALIRKTDSRSVKLMKTARRIVSSSCSQFTPLLYQAYPKLLTERSDNLEAAAKICEMFSLADMVREQTFGYVNPVGLDDDGGSSDHSHYNSIVSSLSVDMPLNLLKDSMKRDGVVSTAGYKSFYGVGNSALYQRKLVRNINALSPNIRNAEKDDLFFLQSILSENLRSVDDDREVAEFLFEYGLSPDKFEMLLKLKGNEKMSLGVPRARKKKLAELYQAIEDEQCASVKFVEPTEDDIKKHRTMKFLKSAEGETEKPPTNDVFTMVW